MSDAPVHFNLYNVGGQKLMTEDGSGAIGINLHNMNITPLSNGIYILEIESNGELTRQKFIVSK